MAEYIDIDSPIEFATFHGRQFTGTIRRILNKSALDYKLADVQPVVHGKWQLWKNSGEIEFFSCDICGFHSLADYNFCPECGSRMDGE